MNLVYFMQAFERLIIVHLFSPNHYVIVLKYSFLLLLTPMIWILGYAQQAYWFQIDHFLLVFLKHGNSFRSENSWQNWNRHCCWGLLTLHFHREIKRCLTSQRACYFETLLSLCDMFFFYYFGLEWLHKLLINFLRRHQIRFCYHIESRTSIFKLYWLH